MSGMLMRVISALGAFLHEEEPCLPSYSRFENNAGGRCAVVVIDVSPSMLQTDWKPSRLKAAQRAAKAYVKRLQQEEPDALVAIVAYSATARVILGPTLVGERDRLTRAIDSMRSSGCTNITAGLEAAFKLLKEVGGTCQVILLTDGEHNTGPGPLAIGKRLQDHAIVECVGVGGKPGDVDEALLKEIASANPDGSKRYRWIGSPVELAEHFDKLAGRITRQ